MLTQSSSGRDCNLRRLAQRLWRGYVSRKATRAMRIEELVFIGMAPPDELSAENDPRITAAEVSSCGSNVQRWSMR